jgi:Ca-activated chloride channel family protein
VSHDDPNAHELGLTDAQVTGQKPSLARRIFGPLVREPDVRGRTYLLLDLSASMGDEGKLPQLRDGALRFFAEAWKLGYEVGAIGFSGRVEVLQTATRDFHRFHRSLGKVRAQGRTSMARAIRVATRKLRRARGDRAILIITDGMPDNPEATLDAAREARAQGITLIAVGTDGADEAFLATLTGLAELARRYERDEFGAGVGSAVASLPRSTDG